MTPVPRGAMLLILRGMALIARGRAEGLNCFSDTPRAFIGSLVPGLGLLAAAVVEGLAEGQRGAAFGEILAPLCALLAPSVLSYQLAQFWGREAFWYRYIVAFNWCQWLLPVLFILLLTVLSLARMAGVSGEAGIRIVILGLAGYALWLNWFVARHGLALTAGRAAGLVALVNLGTAVIFFMPRALTARFE